MSTVLPWTVGLCRGSPGAEDVAEILLARGARVRWCRPDCTHGSDEDEDDPVSIFDDRDYDLDGTPAEEHRGGEHPDWANARPGEELPELPPDGDFGDAPGPMENLLRPGAA